MTYNTEQRSVLLSFLSTNPDKTFSAKEIASSLSDSHISKSAVYRNLADLESENKIKKVSKSGSREAFYQFVDVSECKNHIHLNCKSCGKIFHMENENAEKLLAALAQTEGFELNKGESVLFGTCRECISAKI